MEGEEEGEIVNMSTGELVASNHGAIETQAREWQPGPLSVLSEDDFTRRIKMASLELKRMRDLQVHVMRKDIDYGTIPGTQKPTLYQPGAQILNKIAGFRPDYEVERIDGDGITGPEITYRVRCRLLDLSGYVVGEGFGSSNGWEKKHKYRYADKTCPECGAATIFKAKHEDSKAYYCWRKKGGCGVEFAPGRESEAIDSQPAMTINPDPHELDNTLLKMSCKRAFMAATMNAHAASGHFEVDIEEIAPEDRMSHGGPPPDEAPGPQQSAQNRPGAQATKPAASSSDAGWVLSEGRVKLCYGRLAGRFKTMNWEQSKEAKDIAMVSICAAVGCEKFSEIPSKAALQAVLDAIEVFEG